MVCILCWHYKAKNSPCCPVDNCNAETKTARRISLIPETVTINPQTPITLTGSLSSQNSTLKAPSLRSISRHGRRCSLKVMRLVIDSLWPNQKDYPNFKNHKHLLQDCTARFVSELFFVKEFGKIYVKEHETSTTITPTSDLKRSAPAGRVAKATKRHCPDPSLRATEVQTELSEQRKWYISSFFSKDHRKAHTPKAQKADALPVVWWYRKKIQQ